MQAQAACYFQNSPLLLEIQVYTLLSIKLSSAERLLHLHENIHFFGVKLNIIQSLPKKKLNIIQIK